MMCPWDDPFAINVVIGAECYECCPHNGTKRERPPLILLLRASVEEVGNGRQKLGNRKGLREQDALGQPMGWPVVYAVTRYVNDRDLGIDLAGVLGNVPAGLPGPRFTSVTTARKAGF